MRKIEQIKARARRVDEASGRMDPIPPIVKLNSKKDKKGNSITKTKKIITFIAAGLILYVLLSQFVFSKDFNYFYEIDADERYLTPLDRVVEASTYTNLTGSLVYFDVPIPRHSEKIVVQTRFGKNFPSVSSLSLGAKNKEEWSYYYQLLYDPKNTTVKDGEWVVSETEFDLKDLYVKDGKLNMVFYTPHLNQEQYANYTIPVDWINITVHKPGVFSE